MNRFVIAGMALAVCLTVAVGRVDAQRGGAAQAPKFEVEALWPKPFPVAKHWILGSVTGVTVDAQDHVWVVHRGVDSLQTNEKGPTLEPWASSCCFAAPQVLEFDAAGTLLRSWAAKGGSGYDWPVNPSGPRLCPPDAAGLEALLPVVLQLPAPLEAQSQAPRRRQRDVAAARPALPRQPRRKC